MIAGAPKVSKILGKNAVEKAKIIREDVLIKPFFLLRLTISVVIG